MKTAVIAALIVLAAAAAEREAVAESTPPHLTQPSPSWSVPPLEMMAVWHFRTPVAGRSKQCHVASWYLARYWHTDEWGHTVTWVAYTPLYYVCY